MSRFRILAGLTFFFFAFWGANPLLAEDCPDADGDGAVVCDGVCTVPALKVCGDCNDADANIHPGAAELCDLFTDNDCDGMIDEGFAPTGRESAASAGYDCLDGIDNDGDGFADYQDPQCIAALCSIGDPPNCMAGDAGGCCLTPGFNQCTPDGTGTLCQISVPQRFQSPEGPAGSASCFDAVDNDCDTLTDHQNAACQTAELCNGFDDDNNGLIDDGFGLGAACMVGTGFCERTGVLICDASDATQMTTACSVTPGAASTENTPGVGRCTDGVDNDCDGAADLADVSCQTVEVCDGQDNDGNDGADEDFADLGDPCSAGVGACHVEGVRVCKADGTGTICNAVAGVAGVEGPSGPTCSDSIDNDCDGFEDMGDVSCDAALLSAHCALPYVLARPGDDCTGKHRIEFEPVNASPTALVTAELLGLDTQGNVLATLPVQFGDEAHLASRLSPADFKATSKTSARGTRHEMFAPVPMLRVTVNDGGIIAQAFCTNIPYLDVVEPTGDVVSASEGDITLVRAAIPFVDPSTLQVLVDGVDILAALGIDPATDFPNDMPFNGMVTIDGQAVEVEDLFVRTALDLEALSERSLTMTLRNLGGGGHIIFVDGEPSFTLPPSAQPTVDCHMDDVQDAGTVAVFGITIDSPALGEVTNTVPTPVMGEVRHGRMIREAQVNGLDLDMSAQVCTTGDGMTSADECAVPINVALGQTNLSTGSPGGTFDRGQNDVLARAEDDQANLTFAAQRFTVGDTLAPGLTAEAAQILQARMRDAVTAAVTDDVITPLSNGFTLDNAMVLGVSADGLQKFFDSTCKQATQSVKDSIRELLVTFAIPNVPIDAPFPSCDPTARFDIFDDRGDPSDPNDDPPENQRSVRFMGDLTCTVDPKENAVTVTIGIPDITAIVDVTGGCRVEDPIFGICLVEVVLDMHVSVALSGFAVMADITEDFALAGGEVPSDFISDTATITPDVIEPANNQINCIGVILIILGFLTGGFLLILAGFIFEFGDGIINAALIAAQLEGVGIKEQLRLLEADPLTVQEFNLDEINAQIQSQLGFVQQIVDVEITEGGLVASLNAFWEADTPHPEVVGGASAVTDTAPAPQYPIDGAKEAFFALSDDLFSLLYAGLTLEGALIAECAPSGLTVSDLLPANCSALVGADPLDTAFKRGRCHGAKGTVCSTLALGDGQIFCGLTRADLDFKKIFPTTPLLFCAQGITPRLLVEDDPMTMNVVEARKHFNDLRVTIVLDRAPINPDGTQGDGMLTNQFFVNTFGCFQFLSGLGDCRWADACFDVDIVNNLEIGTNPVTGNPQFMPTIGDIQDNPPGMQCAGGQIFGSDNDLLDQAGASDPIPIIQNNIDALTPEFEPQGFDMGGFLGFKDEMLFSIETLLESDCPTCREYVGIAVNFDLPPDP